MDLQIDGLQLSPGTSASYLIFRLLMCPFSFKRSLVYFPRDLPINLCLVHPKGERRMYYIDIPG